MVGCGPPRSHFDRLSMSGPATGEGRHETCPYEEWRRPHTTLGDRERCVCDGV